MIKGKGGHTMTPKRFSNINIAETNKGRDDTHREIYINLSSTAAVANLARYSVTALLALH